MCASGGGGGVYPSMQWGRHPLPVDRQTPSQTSFAGGNDKYDDENITCRALLLNLDTIKTKKKKQKKKNDPEKINYSEEISSFDGQMSFNDMNLSRPLLKVGNSKNSDVIW